MNRVCLGLPAITGKLGNYAERYQVAEVRPFHSSVPDTRKKLEKWRKMVPPTFNFSVVMNTDEVLADDAKLEAALRCARVLQAAALVVESPPSFRPSQKNRDSLLALASKLPAEGPVRCWSASGMWEPEAVMQLGQEANLLPVFDAAMVPLPPGPVAYTRLKAIGMSQRLGPGRMREVAEQVANRKRAFVIADRAALNALARALTQYETAQPSGRPVPMIFGPETASVEGSDAAAHEEEE